MTGFSDTIDPGDPERRNLPSAVGLGFELEAFGLNVAGVLSRETYDACVPEAWRAAQILPSTRCVYVVGSGGSTFYRRARDARPSSEHPLDEACEVHLAAAAGRLVDQGFATRVLQYWERRGGGFADFVGLAREAGLGTPSRIGLLLHPRFGPWFAIRALLLTARPCPARIAQAPPPDFCADCAAPCIDACPASAVGRDGYDVARCSESRHEDPRCSQRCAARLACPVGSAFRYEDDALAHHMTAHFRES